MRHFCYGTFSYKNVYLSLESHHFQSLTLPPAFSSSSIVLICGSLLLTYSFSLYGSKMKLHIRLGIHNSIGIRSDCSDWLGDESCVFRQEQYTLKLSDEFSIFLFFSSFLYIVEFHSFPLWIILCRKASKVHLFLSTQRTNALQCTDTLHSSLYDAEPVRIRIAFSMKPLRYMQFDFEYFSFFFYFFETMKTNSTLIDSDMQF